MHLKPSLSVLVVSTNIWVILKSLSSFPLDWLSFQPESTSILLKISFVSMVSQNIKVRKNPLIT